MFFNELIPYYEYFKIRKEDLQSAIPRLYLLQVIQFSV